jgi:hypothetical protein
MSLSFMEGSKSSMSCISFFRLLAQDLGLAMCVVSCAVVIKQIKRNNNNKAAKLAAFIF